MIINVQNEISFIKRNGIIIKEFPNKVCETNKIIIFITLAPYTLKINSSEKKKKSRYYLIICNITTIMTFGNVCGLSTFYTIQRDIFKDF